MSDRQQSWHDIEEDEDVYGRVI